MNAVTPRPVLRPHGPPELWGWLEKVGPLFAPYLTELLPALSREEREALLHRGFVALILSVVDGREQPFRDWLEEFFLLAISHGVFMEQIMEAFQECMKDPEVRDFLNRLREHAAMDPQQAFFLVIQQYTRAFQQFSATQMKEFRVLSHLSTIQQANWRTALRQTFRETVEALRAEVGVFVFQKETLRFLFQYPRIGTTEGVRLAAALRRVASAFPRAGQWLARVPEDSVRPVLPLPPDAGTGCALCRNRPILLPRILDASACPWLSGYRISSLICIPLQMMDEEPCGRLLMGRREKAFHPQDFHFLRLFGNDLTRVLQNYLLFQRLEELATTDELTGVANRRALLEAVRREFRRARRYRHPFALVMVDLDHFKRINDTYGHQVGDRVLQEFARAIRKSIRSTDLVGRYGGEEFLILLPEADSRSAVALAERIRERVRQLRVETESGDVVQVTASFGVCAYPEHGKSIPVLLRKADDFLYEAKRRGRDRVVVG